MARELADYSTTQPANYLRQTVGITQTRYALDAGAGLTQVLANTRYDPFGRLLTQSGTGTSAYGFTGEWTDGTGLVHLRARYYSSAQGRFLTRDEWEGDYQRPLSLNAWNYVSANPANQKDPSGYGPDDCLPGIGCLSWLTAGDAVSRAQSVYSKTGPIALAGQGLGGRFDCNNPQWSLPTSTGELTADFICERGPDHVLFDGSSQLTLELARSPLLDRVRREFFEKKGDVPAGKELRFNVPEYGMASLDLVSSGFRRDVPITQFLGSFDYTVDRLGSERAQVRIDNQTDRSSGTHFVGRFPPGHERNNPLSMEQIIDERPELASMSALQMFLEYRDTRGNPVVSVLRPMLRTETQGSGSGVMRQAFSWSERYFDCELPPWPIYLLWLDIQ